MVEQWIAAIANQNTTAATDSELDEAAAVLGVQLPEDYRAVMRHANGGESQFGKSWILIDPLDAVLDRNTILREGGFPIGFTFFGSDGGNDGYAWDTRPERKSLYVAVPFIVPDPDLVIPCGDTFEEFLAALHRGIGFDHSSS
jgi:hypothetical protein